LTQGRGYLTLSFSAWALISSRDASPRSSARAYIWRRLIPQRPPELAVGDSRAEVGVAGGFHERWRQRMTRPSVNVPYSPGHRVLTHRVHQPATRSTHSTLAWATLRELRWLWARIVAADPLRSNSFYYFLFTLYFIFSISKFNLNSNFKFKVCGKFVFTFICSIYT
jgi:hypothetical protein